ncbi:MAG: DNA translocase FtsK [Clostridia bacterium]|nr:DNA translocase FtsK [Clostridia bacterium]
MAAETVNVPEASGDKTDTEAPPVLNKGTDPVAEPAANTVPETPAAENTAPEAQVPKETDAVTLPAPGELLFTHPDIDGDTEFSEGITEAVDRIVEESRPSPIRRHRYSLIRRDSVAEKTALPEATESELEEEAEKREIRSHISKNIDRTNTLFGADPEGGEPSDMVRADSEVVSSLFPERKREKHVKPSLEEYRRKKENISHTRLDFTRNSKKGTDPDVKDQAANGAEAVSEAAADAAKTASMPELKPEAAPKAETAAAPETVTESAAAPETDAPAAETETDSGGRVRLPLLEKQYELPPVDLLSGPRGTDNVGVVNAEDDPKAQKLINTLESFGVGARITGVMRGPAVTRYELQPNPGIKVSRIVALSDDIALNLASTGVRIEAPIPGKEAIGIEVPNQQVEIVALRQVIESSEFRNSASPLSVALGRDIAGKNIVADIAKMPHLLIAGATGSGKSVCINTIVASVLYKAGPADVRMIMIDPKIVELGVYNGIPHLLVPVVTNPKKAAGALSWAVQEMEQRYTAFSEQNVRDIRAYNALAESRKDLTKMPQILIIIDELADLMMVAAKEIEESIIRLAQKARAAGLHIIIATQRPSVDVITGLIKANIPSRIAFAVTSQIDSRTILDGGGAEKLLGRGDMLFHPIGMSKPLRVQGAFVSDSEIEALADSVRSSYGTALYSSDIQQSIDQKDKDKDKDKNQASGGADNGEDDADADLEMIDAAAQLALEYKQLSTSFLQRKLRLGYSRASRIVDFLEAEGLISSADGSKPRQLLMTREEWEQHRAEAEPKA